MGHSGAWVYGVEQGKHSPSPDDLQSLAQVLELSVERLISGDSTDSEFIDRLRSLERSLDERGKRTVIAVAQQQVEESRQP